MSSFSLTEYLLRPIVELDSAIAPHPARKAAQVSMPDDVPSLRAVMRSSRARAWIPPHLIESLGAGTRD